MNQPFRFGVVVANTSSRTEFITLARKAEDLGYSTLLIPDRMVTGLAPLTSLAIAAEATVRLRVGSYMFCNDYRHPALLAKEVATLDFLSGGRFELGMGAGVGPFDYRQLGLPFETGEERVDRFEEALSVIKKLFAEESVNFSGKHYTITGMKGLPRPIQKPHPPIAIGGAGKRMLSLAAREADSISIMFRLPTQGIDAENESLQQKLAWVRKPQAREALALNSVSWPMFLLSTMVEPIGSFEGDGPPLPRIVMSAEQAVEHLLEQREHYGFLIYSGVRRHANGEFCSGGRSIGWEMT